MANTFVGVGVLWGFPGGAPQTLTGLGVMSQIQTMEFNSKAQKEQVRDGNGNTSMVAYTDHEYAPVIDFVVTSGSNAGNATISSLPAVGSTIAFTDANFTVFSNTFMLDDISLSRGNTKAMMAKLTLSRYLNNSLP